MKRKITESPDEVLGLKPARDGTAEEVQWFVRKYITGLNENNFQLLMKHLAPDAVTRILKQSLSEGMELNWSDEP